MRDASLNSRTRASATPYEPPPLLRQTKQQKGILPTATAEFLIKRGLARHAGGAAHHRIAGSQSPRLRGKPAQGMDFRILRHVEIRGVRAAGGIHSGAASPAKTGYLGPKPRIGPGSVETAKMGLQPSGSGASSSSTMR